jgi:hypothetical protein
MQSSGEDTSDYGELLRFQKDLLKLEQDQDRLQKTKQSRANPVIEIRPDYSGTSRIRIKDLLNPEPDTTENFRREGDNEWVMFSRNSVPFEPAANLTSCTGTARNPNKSPKHDTPKCSHLRAHWKTITFLRSTTFQADGN